MDIGLPVLLFIITLLICSCNNNPNLNNVNAVEASLPEGPFEVFIRAFKWESDLELWIKGETDASFKLYKSYSICKKSGQLGPKRAEGDLQVPEGIYRIDRFNPNSAYHLSLGINYPNKSDIIRGDKDSPGSDIFLHGKCVTVGCIPLTDSMIEEIYFLCESAKKRGQNSIYVHIFPARMDSSEFREIMQQSKWNDFWSELLPIYQAFETQKSIPYVLIDSSGKYSIKE